MLTHFQILRAVYHLQENTPSRTARTSDLAAQLKVTGPSATARVQELAAAGLLQYVPRQGAALTDEGKRLALLALQRFRMIERFLKEVLVLPADSILPEAEQFDRFASERVMDGIGRFLAQARSSAAS